MVHHLTDNWGRNVSSHGIAVRQASVLSFFPLEPEWHLVAPSLICGVPAARPQSLEISRVKLRVHTILGDIRHPIRPLGPHPSGVIPAEPPSRPAQESGSSFFGAALGCHLWCGRGKQTWEVGVIGAFRHDAGRVWLCSLFCRLGRGSQMYAFLHHHSNSFVESQPFILSSHSDP